MGLLIQIISKVWGHPEGNLIYMFFFFFPFETYLNGPWSSFCLSFLTKFADVWYPPIKCWCLTSHPHSRLAFKSWPLAGLPLAHNLTKQSGLFSELYKMLYFLYKCHAIFPPRRVMISYRQNYFVGVWMASEISGRTNSLFHGQISSWATDFTKWCLNSLILKIAPESSFLIIRS